MYTKYRRKTMDELAIKALAKINLGFLPVDESNLAYRAARLMKEKYQIEEGIDIRLNKRIPVAAGMAGGSTDAAGVLYGINELFNLGIKRKELMELGVQIGAWRKINFTATDGEVSGSDCQTAGQCIY